MKASAVFSAGKLQRACDFGRLLATTADYQDPGLQRQLENRRVVGPVRFGANTINFATTQLSLAFGENWLGTDANGGDVFARIPYGTRISILFGLMLTICSSVMGVLAGALWAAIMAAKSIYGDNVSSKSEVGNADPVSGLF